MSYDLMFQKANELYSAGLIDEAEQIYRNILEAVPENPDILNMMGLTAQAKNLHQQAISYFSQAIKLSPKHLPLYFNLAFSYQCLQKYIQAIEAYNKVIELNPNIKEAYNNLGYIYEQLNNKEKSLQYYNNALSIDNNYIEAMVNIAVLNNDINSLNDLNKQYPNTTIIHYYIAKYQYEHNKTNQALEHINHADTLDENSFEIKLLKAEINLKLEHKIEAINNFYKVIELNPKCTQAWLNLADLEENENYYLRVLDLEPNNLQAHSNYANFLYKNNRILEALEEYRKAVIINPDLPELSNNLALILKDLGDYEQALDLMMNAFTKDKNNVNYSINIAETLVLFFKKDSEKALNIAHKWAMTYPDNTFAKHTLASFNNENKIIDNQYIETLFDEFALTYDDTMKKIKYNIMEKISELNINFCGNVLDLGCGTGTFADRFANNNIKITGVDMSQNMLNIAAKKNMYHRLIKKDIYKFLTENKVEFDYILALDVLEYAPDLENIINIGYKTTFIFNIETSDLTIDKYSLNYNGRYIHNPEYIRNTLKEYGYNYEEYPIIIRQEDNSPVNGILFIAKTNNL